MTNQFSGPAGSLELGSEISSGPHTSGDRSQIVELTVPEIAVADLTATDVEAHGGRPVAEDSATRLHSFGTGSFGTGSFGTVSPGTRSLETGSSGVWPLEAGLMVAEGGKRETSSGLRTGSRLLLGGAATDECGVQERTIYQPEGFWADRFGAGTFSKGGELLTEQYPDDFNLSADTHGPDPGRADLARGGADGLRDTGYGGIGFDPEGNATMFDSFLQLLTRSEGSNSRVEGSTVESPSAEGSSDGTRSGGEDSQPADASADFPAGPVRPEGSADEFLTTEELVGMTERAGLKSSDASPRSASDEAARVPGAGKSKVPGADAVASISALPAADSKIITARGTEDGLVLRIDGKAEWSNILHDLDSFLGGRKRFFEGGEVSLEWLDRLPTTEQTKELETFLKQNYGMDVSTKRRRPSQLSLARDMSRDAAKEKESAQARSEVARSEAARVEALRSEVLRGESPRTIPLVDEVEQSSFSPYSRTRGAGPDDLDRRAPVTPGYSGAGYTGAGSHPGEPRMNEGRNYPPTYPAPYGSHQSGSSQGQSGHSHSTSSSRESSGAGSFSSTFSGRSADRFAENRWNDNEGFSGGFPGEHSGRTEMSSFGRRSESGGEGLQMGIETEFGEIVGRRHASQISKLLGEDLYYDDEANAKVVFGTLRSGQRIETPFSLIVVGDVNPGADLVAGGDIIVFGSLRGTAHASAYDDDAFDRVILALQMQPMQLRIGSVISRGSDEVVKGAEVARIENRRIIVEAYSARVFLNRKLRS